MQLKSTCLSYFDNLELKEAVFQDRSFPMHLHDTFSIGIIEQGIERLDFGEKECLVTAKSIVVINPGDSHANSCFDQDKVHYRTIYVSRDVIGFIQKKIGQSAANRPIWFEQQPLQDKLLYKMLLDFHQDNHQQRSWR